MTGSMRASLSKECGLWKLKSQNLPDLVRCAHGKDFNRRAVRTAERGLGGGLGSQLTASRIGRRCATLGGSAVWRPHRVRVRLAIMIARREPLGFNCVVMENGFLTDNRESLPL